MLNKLIFTKKMSQQEDKWYAKLLNNLKECKILEVDFNLYKKNLVSDLNIYLFEHP
jgi:hypothetical protein